MEDHVTGLIDQHVAGTDDPIKNVEIATARKRSSGIEGFIESADVAQHVAAERHVATRAEDAGAARIKRIARNLPAKSILVEATPEPVPFLKEHLRGRVKS